MFGQTYLRWVRLIYVATEAHVQALNKEESFHGDLCGERGRQKTFENREADPRSLAPCRRVVIEPPSLAAGCAASLASIREMPAVKGRRRDRE